MMLTEILEHPFFLYFLSTFDFLFNIVLFFFLRYDKVLSILLYVYIYIYRYQPIKEVKAKILSIRVANTTCIYRLVCVCLCCNHAFYVLEPLFIFQPTTLSCGPLSNQSIIYFFLISLGRHLSPKAAWLPLTWILYPSERFNNTYTTSKKLLVF